MGDTLGTGEKLERGQGLAMPLADAMVWYLLPSP